MTSIGQRIIDGLRDAVAGDFARVTIDGQTWVRSGEDAAEIRRLRKGITDYLHGDYPRTAKTDKCKHGRYGFEGCENCIDDYFEKLLTAERVSDD